MSDTSPQQEHRFSRNTMSVYILNWKKVSINSMALYQKISPIIPHTYVINCDENLTLPSTIPHIQLDDSYYYGGQFNAAIKHVAAGHIFCLIVGDNVAENNFEKIFDTAISTFNHLPVGIYAPNDKRSIHTKKLEQISGDLYNVENTDCGFWFIHPGLAFILRRINFFEASNMGWGIDTIFIHQARARNLLVIRDYSVDTDQLDHSTNYNKEKAREGCISLVEIYNSIFFKKS